jgi:membrane protease YdiL (CAAX protease family)
MSLLLGWLFGNLPFSISASAAQAIFSFISYILAIVVIFKAPELFYKLWHKKHSAKNLNSKGSQKFAVTKSDLGLNELPTWTDIGLAPVGFIVYNLLAGLFASLFSFFPWFNISETQDVGFNSVYLVSDRIFAFITLVIIAPIAEELIFRGYLYRKIKDIFFKKNTQNLPESATQKKHRKKHDYRELTAIVIATLITSLAFGIMHGQWNVGVNVFAMSIILCIMREITGSIYSGILLHMLKNAIAFYLLYVATPFF